jgi:hypothetical protein
MDLSQLSKDELIELVRQLQFSLNETHVVIQKLARELPAIRRRQQEEAREASAPARKLSLEEHLEKHNMFKLYEYIVAADVFNGIEGGVAEENAIDTIVEMLEIEGIPVEKETLSTLFPSSAGQP